jgi:hypothetical protein
MKILREGECVRSNKLAFHSFKKGRIYKFILVYCRVGARTENKPVFKVYQNKTHFVDVTTNIFNRYFREVQNV